MIIPHPGKKRPASRDNANERDNGPPPKRHQPKQRDAASYLEKAIEDALVKLTDSNDQCSINSIDHYNSIGGAEQTGREGAKADKGQNDGCGKAQRRRLQGLPVGSRREIGGEGSDQRPDNKTSA